MALYHFHVSRILRSRGQSSVEAAAYRAGEKLEDRYYGKTADYTKKGGVILSEILAPDFVPGSFHDRQTLWNAVEEAEKHPKAQLAYSFDIALQNEFTLEENIEIARKFVKENFVARGMICDMAVHDPYKEGGIQNPHFHVMCPVRPMKEDGTWGEKQKREYLVDENGDPVLDSKGKQKFNAVPTTDWNRPEVLEDWRKAWADQVNEEFRKRDINESIDHRSYVDQGLELIPQIHEGPHVRKMEKKGIITEKGSLNRWIKEINKGIIVLSKQIRDIIANISELMKLIAEMEAESRKPELADYINEYFDRRNVVADSYVHGGRKARITNLKLHAKIVNYLTANEVRTLDGFKEHVSGKQQDLYKLNDSMKNKASKISELKDLIRYGEWYIEAQPVIREICSTKNVRQKEKIKSENDAVLRKYHIAKRILFEEKKISKIDIKGWSAEIEGLQASYHAEYEVYKNLNVEINTLREINRYIDDSIRGKKTKRREEPAR